jgi:hypothetical protein
MDEIYVVNNFLSTEDLTKVLESSKYFRWSYGQLSIEGAGNKFWGSNLMNNDLFKTHIFHKIESFFKKKFILHKVFANGQTYGMNGIYHTDTDADYTFLLYISDITHDNADIVDGHTLFKNGDDVLCVEPILNRGVLFKSNILHKALAPSRSADTLRISIAFKLREIE